MRLRATKKACCALVWLCMQLLPWPPLCLLLCGGVVASANELFGFSDHPPEVLSENVGTLTVTAEQSTDLEDTELGGLLFTSDVIDEGTAELENITIEPNTENAEKHLETVASAQKPSDPSRAFKDLCMAMVLALCLGFLALRWERAPSQQAVGENNVQQTGSVDENLGNRLKALRALIPVAKELGKAVGTAEAREFLEAIHSRAPKEGEEEDSTKLEMSLEKALSALRGLRQAAVEEAGYILRKDFDNLRAVTSLVEEWEEAHLSRKELEELSPFITALTLSRNHFLQVSQQMQEVYEGLKQPRPLGDERDVDLLLSTANGFKLFVKLQQEREYAANLATEQRTMAEAAMRMTLSRATAQGFRQRWGGYEVARAHLNIAREAGGATPAEGQTVAEEDQGYLEEAELLLAIHETKLKQLMDYSRTTSRDIILGMLTRNSILEQEQESLRASLMRHWDHFSKHMKMPEKLEDRGRECIKGVVSQALQRVTQDRDMMDAAITSTLSTMAQVFADPELNNKEAISKSGAHDVLQRRMAAGMLRLLGKWERRFVLLQSDLQSLDQEQDSVAAAKMMEDAVASTVLSSDDLTAVRLSQLRINLLISVEQTAKRTMEEAAKVSDELRRSPSSSYLGPTELGTLLAEAFRLERLLTQACWAARNAGALEDRIEAAARMQELGLDLRHISYILKGNDATNR
ncbi:hypothetical protein ACSSS7_002649 [Eimeria intestinalis]